MRIAQTVIAPVLQVHVCEIEPDQEDTPQTSHNTGNRGTAGFGSTGHT
ncbi:deoxyuridine 5'-triphosphate nucleotidohydrolase [Candidatus Bartonella washoeensis]|nr:deoxyuridine 5'-triphosphate nucleotidohydrolase [Bartonella washoeensis Sb944nv]SPU26086.1 deoxyuridine 5'-triphosphate nucleotidohydrolase [Bartonella washoeensis]